MIYLITIQIMTNKQQSHNCNPQFVTKSFSQKTGRPRCRLCACLKRLMILTCLLTPILTGCDTSDAKLNTELIRLKSELSTLRITLNNVKAEQSTLATETDSLFKEYRFLHKYFQTLDTANVTDRNLILMIRDQQMAVQNAMARIVHSMETLNEMFNQLQAIAYDIESRIDGIENRITAMETRIEQIPRDTLREYIGDGNFIYTQPMPDSMTIIMNDSVKFQFWQGGSRVIPPGEK